MVRFNRLSREELEVLESKFIEFLAAQGITGEDWRQIQEKQPEQVDSYVDAFSDVVYGSVLRSAEYLECRSRNSITCFQLLDKKAVLVRMEITQGSQTELDLRDTQTLTDLANGSIKVDASVYVSEKPWAAPREDEIFKMMTGGCEITDGRLFKALCLLL